MTTKLRIITGFLVLLVILGAMALLGYLSLQTSTNNFNDYRRMANVNVDASDLQSAVAETVYYTQLYLAENDNAMIQEANARIERGQKAIAHLLEISQIKENVESANRAGEMLIGMQADLKSLQSLLNGMNKDYTQYTLPGLDKVDKALQLLAKNGRSAGNADTLYYQIAVWSGLSEVKENMKLYIRTLDENAEKQLTAAVVEVRTAIADLGGTMLSEMGRRDHETITAAIDEVAKGVEPVLKSGDEAQTKISHLRTKAREVFDLVGSLNVVVDKSMREKGAETLESNQSGQAQLVLVSAVGLLLGIAFAVYTIFSLVRTLGSMSHYASDIADGNFNSQVNITEKGEIGVMFASMRRIPEIFSGVIGRCNVIANDIASGQFRDRLDVNRFSGGFAELATGINVIADSYTSSIDNLPVAIVTLDKQLHTKFANTAGREMLGEDALKAFGGKMPLMEASLHDNKIVRAETGVVAPDGRKVVIAATAMPLSNLKGEVVAGLEVLTDISEIKQKQEVMLQVASQASEISNRVAAASEQLSAQVEQVSRGAEMQRQRVESTASAMTEMNSTVLEVARSAGEASEQSENTRAKANDGASLVNRVVQAINQVNTVSMTLQSNMQELGDQAESVGGVINVISDIADQTNLLALNAAIEAARAGEAGRGFAVVADEVRKLAEKTMAATHEVDSSITAIQHSARSNIDEVGHAVTNITDATNLANSSGEALKEIVDLASANSAVVASIATAAEEQSATSEEINRAIEEINHVVGETTEGMIQSSAAVQELSQMAQELRRVMDGLQ
ncbi:methyl-accepting chemotaxis protein [Desulfovibrio sp. OttesenSCG-928-F20]|nr:methyl-accepting chemotaxis protein [Desulfovibrio sp. OttesenSCG-928-F20]